MNFNKGNYNFNKDILQGEKGEEVIKNILVNMGFVFIKYNKDNKFDLLMEYNNRQITYEIKTDIYPKNTGNLVIEFECRGKLSGISVTKADYFVTYFPHLNEIWNIKTSILIKLINQHKPRISENSGDKGSNTKLYILNKNKFRNYFKVYNFPS